MMEYILGMVECLSLSDARSPLPGWDLLSSGYYLCEYPPGPFDGFVAESQRGG